VLISKNQIDTLCVTVFIFIIMITFSLSQVHAEPIIYDDDYVVEKFVTGLEFPTTMVFVGNDILVLEKNTGKVIRIQDNGVIYNEPALDVPVVFEGEAGLLGIASVSNHIYLYFTESLSGFDKYDHENSKIVVYQYDWNGKKLTNPILIKELPVFNGSHLGGVIATGLNNEVYFVIGDQWKYTTSSGDVITYDIGSAFQNVPINPTYKTGNIFRVDTENNNNIKLFAMGIRNSFGLAVDPVTGYLWDTENSQLRFDEINLVKPGFNSGWISVMGPADRADADLSTLSSNPSENFVYSDPEFSWYEAVAPTAISFPDKDSFRKYSDSLFVGDFNTGAIYNFQLNSDRTGFVFSNPDLSDLVLDDNDEIDEILFASGFQGVIDIKFHDGAMYAVSDPYGDGIIYKIYPKEPLSPFKQYENNVTHKKIVCKTELMPIMSKSGSIYCVYPKTALTVINVLNWSVDHPEMPNIELRFQNLSGLNFEYLNLSNSDLRGSNFDTARISNVNFSNANLSRADLSGKDLTGTTLTGADLSNSILTGVDLSGKDLTGTRLVGVDLSGRNFDNLNLQNAVFDRADLSNTSFKNANIDGTRFMFANLNNSNLLDQTDLSNINFAKADLSNVSLKGKNLSDTILTGADLSNSILTGVDLSGKDLTETILKGVDLSNAILTDAILQYANLEGANVKNADFTSADFTYANLAYTNLKDAKLDDAKFTSAKFKGVDISLGSLPEINLVKADLSEAILTNADLSDKDLSKANLSGQNLSSKDLTNTILAGADLTDTILPDSTLSGKDFTYSVFDGVDLSGEDLSYSNFQHATFSNANMENANLEGAEVIQVDLTEIKNKSLAGADLSGSSFAHSNLSGVNLSGVILHVTNFWKADLSGVDFTVIDVITPLQVQRPFTDGLSFVEANLSNSNFEGVNLSPKVIHSTPFENMAHLKNLSDFELVKEIFGKQLGVELGNIHIHIISREVRGNDLILDYIFFVNFRDANLQNANFSNAGLNFVKFSSANLTNADLTGADLRKASLYNADLSNANLDGANLEGANLQNADLIGAHLTGVDLTGVNLTGVDLTGADLTGADLTGANLTGANLSNIIYDQSTILKCIGHPICV